MDGAKTTAVAVGVLGGDPLTCRILGLLLAGAGYGGAGYGGHALDATAVSEDPSAALAGVDLVLLVPGLDNELEGEPVGAIEGDPATAAVPVLGLSPALRKGPGERQGSVPWPWTVEALVGAIERVVLVPALGDGREASSQV